MDDSKLKQDIEIAAAAVGTKEDKTGKAQVVKNAQLQAQVDHGTLLAARIQDLVWNRALARVAIEAKGDKWRTAQGVDIAQTQAQADRDAPPAANVQGQARNRVLARATSTIHVHNGVNAHFRARTQALAGDRPPSNVEEYSPAEVEGNHPGEDGKERVVKWLSTSAEGRSRKHRSN